MAALSKPNGTITFKARRVQLAVAVVFGHAIKHIYVSGLRTIVMPEIKIGLSLNASEFGSLATARSLTGGVTTLVAGYLGDRFSHKAPLMLGLSLGLMGFFLMAAGFAPNFWVLFGVMFFVSVGPALYHPPALSALSRRFPDSRGFAVSLHGTGGIAGEVIGPVFVAMILGFMMWRDVLKVSLFPAVIAAFFVWAMMRTSTGDHSDGTVSSLRDYFGSLSRLLRNHAMLFLVIATALNSAGNSAVGEFLPVYLREDLDFSPTRVAVYLSLARVAGLGFQPIMGFFSDRFSRKAILVPTLAATAGLSLLLPVASSGVPLFLIVAITGAFSFSIHHIIIAAALDVARGKVQSTVVSLIYGAGLLATFSPYVAGIIADHFDDVRSAFLYGGSVMIIPTIMLAWLKFPKRGAS